MVPGCMFVLSFAPAGLDENAIQVLMCSGVEILSGH